MGRVGTLFRPGPRASSVLGTREAQDRHSAGRGHVHRPGVAAHERRAVLRGGLQEARQLAQASLTDPVTQRFATLELPGEARAEFALRRTRERQGRPVGRAQTA